MGSYLDFFFDFTVIIYNFIDIWSLIVMCPLPLCCSDDTRKCEWKIMNNKKHRKKKTMKKTLIWKNNIVFLNFHKNITFTFLRPSKILLQLPCQSSDLNEAWRTFFNRWSVIAIFRSLPVVFKSCEWARSILC